MGKNEAAHLPEAVDLNLHGEDTAQSVFFQNL